MEKPATDIYTFESLRKAGFIYRQRDPARGDAGVARRGGDGGRTQGADFRRRQEAGRQGQFELRPDAVRPLSAAMPGHEKATLQVLNPTDREITTKVRNMMTGEIFPVTVPAGDFLMTVCGRVDGK